MELTNLLNQGETTRVSQKEMNNTEVAWSKNNSFEHIFMKQNMPDTLTRASGLEKFILTLKTFCD